MNTAHNAAWGGTINHRNGKINLQRHPRSVRSQEASGQGGVGSVGGISVPGGTRGCHSIALWAL